MLEPHYVVSDAEVVAAVESVAAAYRERRNSVKALLAAPVEVPEPPVPPPTRAEIEAALGRQVGQNGERRQNPPSWHGDGKHAQRVEADLAARRARRLLEQSDPSPAVPATGNHG